jgi:hypothetical protein
MMRASIRKQSRSSNRWLGRGYLLAFVKIGSGAYGAGPRSWAAVHENIVPTSRSDEAHSTCKVVIGRADGTHSTVSFHLRAHALGLRRADPMPFVDDAPP